MIIRDAYANETAALVELLRAASLVWDDQREWVLANPDLINGNARDLDAQIPAGGVRVAEEGDELLGFSAIVRSADGEADLDGLFVSPARMRTGIGAALVADVVERLRRDGVRRLTVLANLNALGFYERVGFTAFELRPTDFKEAMLMEILIPSPSSPA